MDKPISPGLKIVFALHAVVGAIFGLAFLVVPETFADLLNFTFPSGSEPYVRLVGAAILGFTASSILGYLAHSWQEVKIVLQAEIPWTFLGAVVTLWYLIDGALPAAAWINFIALAAFFVAFTFYFWREETMPVPKAV